MKRQAVSHCLGVMARLALIALVAGFATAQEYRAKVQGLVTDPSQAGIAGAKVALKNVNTGIEAVRETDATGRFLFEFVQPGTYMVSVEATGFSKFIQENITVRTGGDVTVNELQASPVRVGELMRMVEAIAQRPGDPGEDAGREKLA